jgi:hypothetical protein
VIEHQTTMAEKQLDGELAREQHAHAMQQAKAKPKAGADA